MENILITFESDTTGLNAGKEALSQIAKTDQNLATAFTKTNETLKQREQVINSNKTALSSYAESLNSVGKATTGAFGTKVLNDFKTAGVQAVSAITDQIKKLQVQKAALDNSKLKTDDVKLYNIALQTVNKELDKLQAELKQAGGVQPFKPLTNDLGNAADAASDAADSINDINDVQNKATASGLTFITQLRKMESELVSMSHEGRTFSTTFNQSFDELQASAAHLRSSINNIYQAVSGLASSSSSVDAVLQGFGTLAAGGQIAAVPALA